MPEQKQKENASTSFVWLLILIHLLVALPLAYTLNIWVDEASTLYTTQNGFFQAFRNALADELQAPLYFWLLSIWRQIDSSIFFARLFSIICSLLAIKVSFDVAKRFLPETARKFAPFITSIFALHPLLFWASTEIRGYSLVILLSALLLRFFYDGFLTDEGSRKDKLLYDKLFYTAVAVAALYTNYFLGFLLVGNFCALLILRRFKQAVVFLGCMIAVGICFSPLLFALSQQFETRSEIGDRSFLEALRTIWQHIQTFLLPVNVFSEDANAAAFARLWIFRAGTAGMFVYLVIKRFKGVSPKTIALGVICLVPAVFLFAVITAMGAGYANIRHASFLLLPAVLFFSALLYETFSRKGLLVWAALLLFFIPFSTWQVFSGLVKRGDWEKAAAYVQSHEKAGQTILLFKPYDSLAFKFYYDHYRGKNAVLPQEGFFAWSRQNHFNFTEQLPEQADSLISQIPPESGEVWLLTGEICAPSKNAAKTADQCQALEEHFNSNYTMIDEQDFYLEKVRLYRKK